MVINDAQGMYEIKIDTNRRIAFITARGHFTLDVMQRLHSDHLNHIIPVFEGQKWAKCVDLGDLKICDDTNFVNQHNIYCETHGMTYAALIVDRAIVKLQMDRSARGLESGAAMFASYEDADKWLREHGF